MDKLPMPATIKALLDVNNLRTRFRVRKRYVYAVNGVSFHVDRNEILGIVGESGCGKSVTMLSVLRLLPPAAEIESGKVLFNESDLLTLSAGQMRKIRGSKIGMIFQDPMTSLNPVLSIGIQLAEPLIFHKNLNHKQAETRCVDLLNLVGISDAPARLKDYPHQLSGGMRQRVMIAMALACEPDLVIADEPTTALDVTIQAQIIDLVKELKAKLGMAIVWITHDLSVIAGLADRVVVMYAGYIVEEANVYDIYNDPRHPYTLGLIHAVPSIHQASDRVLQAIPGTPPDLAKRPTFCPFLVRCPFAVERCKQQNPTLTPIADDDLRYHRVACWIDVREGIQS
jgi:oligopeptide/dipeptide ABC transporter ATP-binding protein